MHAAPCCFRDPGCVAVLPCGLKTLLDKAHSEYGVSQSAETFFMHHQFSHPSSRFCMLQGTIPPHLASITQHTCCRVLSSIMIETCGGELDIGTHPCIRQVEGTWGAECMLAAALAIIQ